LYESVPPRLYGGTERVVSHLTEELVAMGHDVTLFASSDSVSSARVIPGAPRALRLSASCRDPLIPHFLMMEELCRMAEQFDVVHCHIDYLHLPFARRLDVPMIATLHGRLDLPDLPGLYKEYREARLVSISDAQRAPIPHAPWLATVHHGLPERLYRPGAGDGGYLAFLGRISPEKRVDRAIEIAQRAGRTLRIAAKVDPVDRDYFGAEIEPLLSQPYVEFLGEVGEGEKSEFLGRAAGLLFPIDWPEPFGLVMIEAMACGTPVVAWRAGSVPEIISEGESGYVVESIDQAVEAVARLDALDRRACRAAFDERFTARRMAEDYVRLYRAAASRGIPALKWTDDRAAAG
jgi:glycosyltransferase involved in cell wall biosynthesis